MAKSKTTATSSPDWAGMAANKDFVGFEVAMKAAIDNKLANNPRVKAYSSQFDKFKNMKDSYAKINTDFH